MLSFNGIELSAEAQMKFYDAWGSEYTYNHFAVPWTWAFDTPYKWTEQIPSFFGGTRNGMAISWPARLKDNHRTFLRSHRPERVGKSPKELMTGQSHPHWLELLGFTRFQLP